MAATLNLQQTILWTGPYIRYQSLTIGGLEPAVSNANLVKSTILGAPFAWPWNRSQSAPISCAAGQQDYTVPLTDFGFIEKAWITLAGVTTEIEVVSPLAVDSTQARPAHIAVQQDDGEGSITFRLMPAPDAAYVLTVLYQKKCLAMSSLASRWAPIPDELGYIYQYGFLALSLMVTQDARFPIFNDRFVAHLLGAQDGLTSLQRSIFLAGWLDVMAMGQRAQAGTQQGMAGRAK